MMLPYEVAQHLIRQRDRTGDPEFIVAYLLEEMRRDDQAFPATLVSLLHAKRLLTLQSYNLRGTFDHIRRSAEKSLTQIRSWPSGQIIREHTDAH